MRIFSKLIIVLLATSHLAHAEGFNPNAGADSFSGSAGAQTMHGCAPFPKRADVYLAPYSNLNTRIAQSKLNRLGYGGASNGVYGPAVRQTIQRFQGSEGLMTADGIEWPPTIQQLALRTVYGSSACSADAPYHY
jgi:hypothetical protein